MVVVLVLIVLPRLYRLVKLVIDLFITAFLRADNVLLLTDRRGWSVATVGNIG